MVAQVVLEVVAVLGDERAVGALQELVFFDMCACMIPKFDLQHRLAMSLKTIKKRTERQDFSVICTHTHAHARTRTETLLLGVNP